MILAALRDMGLDVFMVGSNLKLSGMDKLTKDDAARALALAREHKADLAVALTAETTPAPGQAALDPVGPGPESACDMPPQNGGGDTAHEDARGEFLPSKDNCRPYGCCVWVGNGAADRLVTWRCAGALAYDGVDPDDADLPRLADLSCCAWLVLEGGGPSGLSWWPEYPDADTDMPSYEACGSLRDLARRYDLRLVRSGDGFAVRFPQGASPILVCYGDELLSEALPFIEQHLGVAHA